MNQEETKKREQEILAAIESLPTDDTFKLCPGLPIPFRDAVLILPWIQNEQKTAAGIIIPGFGDSANDRQIGFVAAIGPKVDLPIKIGMKVYFERKANHYAINGKDGNVYLMMIQHYVYCAWTPDSYYIPEWKTREEKRNDARREGLENVSKAETEALNDENTQIKIG